MRYLSVCSGIEAASAAWHPLGWEPVAFAEVEPFPCSVLAHHYPQTPNWGDMTRWKEWPDAAVDVLVGGTPCQSFSVAGLRGGLNDPRGGLMLQFLGIADRYRPRWIVWENVPGVLSSSGGRDFGTFLGALGELGYGWAYRVLDAQWFGVAQRRRRVFVVGCLGDQRSAAQVLFERESVRRDIAPRREARERIAGTLSSRTTAGGGLGTDFELSGGLQEVVGSLDTQCGGGKLAHQSVANGHVIGTLTARMFNALGARDVEEGALLPVVNPVVLMDQGGSVMGTLTDGTVGTLRRETHGHEPVVAFPANLSGTQSASTEGVACNLQAKNPTAVAIAPAITASNDPSRSPQSSEVTQQVAAVHQASMQVRRLTPRECERLQGFPDDYTQVPHRGKLAADGPRYKALGNSMAVPCMAWIGARIQRVEGTGHAS